MQNKLEKIKKLKKDLQNTQDEYMVREKLYHDNLMGAYKPVTKEEYDASTQDKIYIKGVYFILHKDNLRSGQYPKMLLKILQLFKDYKEYEKLCIEEIMLLKNQIQELEQELKNTTEE
ncbi:MAG: hypothetical protein JJT94_12625 [Bernardetiaceae bacterium]|nr:hypothetical protein [Bernardetiaceae bacterium]